VLRKWDGSLPSRVGLRSKMVLVHVDCGTRKRSMDGRVHSNDGSKRAFLSPAQYTPIVAVILFLINVAPPLQKAFRQIDECGETRQ
jgi:hypothetical protein